jgi:hypothetical protein
MTLLSEAGLLGGEVKPFLTKREAVTGAHRRATFFAPAANPTAVRAPLTL